MVPKALWDAAMAEYHKSIRDEERMCQAWRWMERQGFSWAPSDPVCYVAIAHAITAQGRHCEGEPLAHTYLIAVSADSARMLSPLKHCSRI